jgi:hypothetical protein
MESVIDWSGSRMSGSDGRRSFEDFHLVPICVNKGQGADAQQYQERHAALPDYLALDGERR